VIQTVIYGFTIGAILYFFSVGLSLTFGTMHIINFAHGMVYALGVYLFITLLEALGNSFLPALAVSLAAMLPVAYLIERLVIRRLYGESLDYAIIATYGVLLIGTDAIKLIWGTTPYPISDPVGLSLPLVGMDLPVYRLLIVVSAVALFLALRVFFKRSIIGRIVTAALEDSDGVRCLGLDVNRYFSIIFVLGSALAVLGGILYAPVSTAEPYMGFHILLLAFAVVIVGGMGNLNGTFVAAMVLGMVMAVTGRFWSQAANAMVFVVMALVIMFRPTEGK
jgi:branched-subunit amino acid ABC-type transport system permease component